MEDLINQLNAFQIDEQTVFLVFILIATVVIIFTLFMLLLGSKSPITLKLEEIRKSTGSEKLKKKSSFR